MNPTKQLGWLAVIFSAWLLSPCEHGGLLRHAAGQPAASLERAAAKIQAATVTVRLWNPPPEAPQAENRDELANPPAVGNRQDAQVTICSGVAISPELVVAPIYAGSDSQIKITLAGGEQHTARLRVIDEHSGLALLRVSTPVLKFIAVGRQPPQVGAWVLSAAGWGTEAPVVSAGIVGGVDRTLAQASYPPLLQCDLRTTITSSGAGVVNAQGDLVGIVVAIDRGQEDRGWTYAVPAVHVERLSRVHATQTDRESVMVLKRRRPVVGMILDGRGEAIVVVRVHPDSPAEQAGLRVGDEVLETDGVKIRSVYQALRPVLNKQAGDKITFRVRREQTIREMEVVLGGGVELPAASFANLQQYLQPKLDVEHVGDGIFATRTAERTLQEVFAPPEGAEDKNAAKPLTAAEKILLLEKALERYQRAIVYLQNRLGREQEDRLKTEKLLRELEQQVESLKKQLPIVTPPSTGR